MTDAMDPADGSKTDSGEPVTILYGVVARGQALNRAQWTVDRELALDMVRGSQRPVELWKAERTPARD